MSFKKSIINNIKPFIKVTYENHEIVVINTFKKCLLIIDGKEFDSYNCAVALPFCLKGHIGNDSRF